MRYILCIISRPHLCQGGFTMPKTALITGASRGIGAAIAVALARDGIRVFINYNHSKAAAESLAAVLGGQAVQCDVSNQYDVEKMFDIVGGADILVNNAGIAHYGLMGDMTLDQWRAIFAVNTDGMFLCCKYALPHMIHQKSGCIINMSSVWGQYGASCEAAYSASKAAVIGLTKSLAKELGPSGIRVNCIAPGVIDTDMLSPLCDADKRALADDTPLCRLGAPEDVAAVAAFLASDSAGFITGQVIGADGGFAL